MELIGKAKDVSDTIIGHKNNNDVNIANNNDPNTVINNTSASRMQMNGSKNDADPSLNAVQRQILVCETSKELRNYSELYVEPVHIGYDGQPIAVLEGVEDNDRNHNYHHRGQDNDLGSGISSVVSNTKELEGIIFESLLLYNLSLLPLQQVNTTTVLLLTITILLRRTAAGHGKSCQKHGLTVNWTFCRILFGNIVVIQK